MRIDFATRSVAFQTPLSAMARVIGTTSATETPACACGSSGCNCASSKVGASEDTVELSVAAKAEHQIVDAENGEKPADAPSSKATATELSEEEQAEVRELKARDAEVRAHEQAHLAAAGGHAKGGPTYEFERGPDGRNYAVGGEVSIDTSPVDGDPAATIAKMNKLIAAANAPAQPSGQDRAVAAQAAAARTQAQAELAEQSDADSADEAVGASVTTAGKPDDRDDASIKKSAVAKAYPAEKRASSASASLLNIFA